MTGTIFLKSPWRMSSMAALKNGMKSSMDSGSHSICGAPPSSKRVANSSTLSSSHDDGWRHGWGSSRKKSAMKNAGRDGRRIGDCSNGPHPTKTRPGAVWMKAKSRATLLRYTTVPDPETIRTMFASIARRYDRANTVMSGGIHHLWRRRAVRRARVRRGDAVLDCATGTGDLAIAFKRAVGPRGRVVGTDFTPEMIALARAKAQDVIFEVADVTK